MNRRDFIQVSSGVVSGMLLVNSKTAFGYDANSKVRLGLLGCGNRGTSVADSFVSNTAAQIVALADLFLDTFPYNAHATTSDFLAAGVPVLTVKGRTFASRVAASLLTQVGAEGLIARGLDVYERMALDFAMNPGTLQPWRQHLLTHKRTAADTVRLARGLEAAYFHMWERRMKGLKPESFTLAP